MYEILMTDADDLFAELGARANAEILEVGKLMLDDKFAATAGLSKIPDDPRIWGFFDIKGVPPNIGMVIVRAIRSFLVSRQKEVYIQCESEAASRFLRILGFTKTEEQRPDLRTGELLGVWVWRH